MTEFAEKVRKSLEGLGLANAEILFEDPDSYRLVAVLLSDSFDGMEEGERQEMVWGKLLADFDDDEIRRVEFVFTQAPSDEDLNEVDEAAEGSPAVMPG